MFRAKIYFDLDRNCILSAVTSRWNTSFPVSQEEVIDDEYIQFVIDGGDRADELHDAFVDAEAVREVEHVDDSRLVLTKRSCGALPVIRGNHGMLQGWDRVNGDQRVFDIVVFRRDDLRAIVSDLRELGSVELARLTPYQAPDSLLSSRQAEVVQAALDAGYFEWPRETDAQTLAADLGISHTTFLEHLRKAERTLLGDALSRGTSGDAPTPDEREFMLRPAATDGGDGRI